MLVDTLENGTYINAETKEKLPVKVRLARATVGAVGKRDIMASKEQNVPLFCFRSRIREVCTLMCAVCECEFVVVYSRFSRVICSIVGSIPKVLL